MGKSSSRFVSCTAVRGPEKAEPQLRSPRSVLGRHCSSGGLTWRGGAGQIALVTLCARSHQPLCSWVRPPGRAPAPPQSCNFTCLFSSLWTFGRQPPTQRDRVLTVPGSGRCPSRPARAPRVPRAARAPSFTVVGTSSSWKVCSRAGAGLVRGWSGAGAGLEPGGRAPLSEPEPVSGELGRWQRVAARPGRKAVRGRRSAALDVDVDWGSESVGAPGRLPAETPHSRSLGDLSSRVGNNAPEARLWGLVGEEGMLRTRTLGSPANRAGVGSAGVACQGP